MREWHTESARLAARALAAGEPTAWFEELYAAGARAEVTMPWDRGHPAPLLAQWLSDITSFAEHGLDPVTVEQLDDGVLRWRAEFLRSAP
jgi:hypothetical protein